MSEMPTYQTEFATDPEGPQRNPTRRYIIIAAILLIIILVAAILLLVFALPALREDGEATEMPTVANSPTPVPTFTAAPTTAATQAPTPTLVPTSAPADELVMRDTDDPIYEFASAGARPSTEWTGFFGQVLDAAGNPVAGALVVVWYSDGQPAADPAETGADGSYEIHLAEAPYAGTWSVQVLLDDYQPASKLVTFATDLDTAQGVQQIQVIWQEIGP